MRVSIEKIDFLSSEYMFFLYNIGNHVLTPEFMSDLVQFLFKIFEYTFFLMIYTLFLHFKLESA